MRKLSFLPLALACLLLPGCTPLIEGEDFWVFRIAGSVTDEDDNPIPGVEVYFIDVGLSQSVEKYVRPDLVGMASQQGTIVSLFPYPWLHQRRYSKGPPKLADVDPVFQVLLTKPGYYPLRLSFDFFELREVEGEYLALIDAILPRFPSSGGLPGLTTKVAGFSINRSSLWLHGSHLFSRAARWLSAKEIRFHQR